MNQDTSGEITRHLRVRDILNMRLVCTEFSRVVPVPPIRYTFSAFRNRYISARVLGYDLVVSSKFVSIETETTKIDLYRKKFAIKYYTAGPIPPCTLMVFDGIQKTYWALAELFPNALDEIPAFVYINSAPSKILVAGVNAGCQLYSVSGDDVGNSFEMENDRVQLRHNGNIICNAAEGLARPGFIAIPVRQKTFVDDTDNVCGHYLSLRDATAPVLMHITDAYRLYCRTTTPTKTQS